MNYDNFQKKAIQLIDNDASVIVTAPTGAGKTVIAEYVINRCLSKGKSVIYTAPIKALSNQKYRDFKSLYGDKIGILTGDVSINPAAQVLIMTTEIFRNKVLERTSSLENYEWIIFDEIHYLDDYERGTVWEESIIFLPDNMRILGLSATIPNINEFTSWIGSIHNKKIEVVEEYNRPVPLHFFYQCHNSILDNLKKIENMLHKDRNSIHNSRQHYNSRHRHNSRQHHFNITPNKTADLIKKLHDDDRLPCIYFCFDRRKCEQLASETYASNIIKNPESAVLKKMYDELCEKHGLTSEKSAQKMAKLVENGIAYHHAGMLPTLKEVIETLFTSRLIKVIFTTETFALGINMPARSVIFDELRKFYGRFFSFLKTRDFYQMAGRAGRRGIDTEGFVYSRINPRYIGSNDIKEIIYSEPEPVVSRFNTSYATILNLYRHYGEDLYKIYPYSFHCYQQKKRQQKFALALMRSKVDLLKKLGYIKNGKLSEKGEFASKVYGYELSIAELYGQGILDTLNFKELGILALALVFEPRKKSFRPPLTKDMKRLKKITNRIVNVINVQEKKFRIEPLSKKYFFNLTPCLEGWINNETFDKILQRTDADEGEIIRYFRMAIQVLREILDTPISVDLQRKVHKMITLINRGIINAEKQLREDVSVKDEVDNEQG